jgi:hypothetical protein
MPQSKVFKMLHFKTFLLMKVISAIGSQCELHGILQSDEGKLLDIVLGAFHLSLRKTDDQQNAIWAIHTCISSAIRAVASTISAVAVVWLRPGTPATATTPPILKTQAQTHAPTLFRTFQIKSCYKAF